MHAKATDEYLRIGDRVVKSFPLVDVDEIDLPNFIRPYPCNRRRLSYRHRPVGLSCGDTLLRLCDL